MASVGEDVEKIVYPLLVGILNGAAIVANSRVISKIINHGITIWSSNFPSGYILPPPNLKQLFK